MTQKEQLARGLVGVAATVAVVGLVACSSDNTIMEDSPEVVTTTITTTPSVEYAPESTKSVEKSTTKTDDEN